MRIAFLPLASRHASGRLRCIIPAQQLARLGHTIETSPSAPVDWLVLSKHGWPPFERRGERVCFDVCDDHFDHTKHGPHYRHWVERADLVTCNSAAMRERIKAVSGRDAVLLDDPYESDEKPPKCHEPLLWFGHPINYCDLAPILPKLPETVVVSGASIEGANEWSPATMARAWEWCGLVVLPTGPKQCKSANRAVESLRNGLYPVCGPLPAYAELGLGTQDIPGEVRHWLAYPEDTKSEIRRLQGVIRDRFSPETVGREWERALHASSNP